MGFGHKNIEKILTKRHPYLLFVFNSITSDVGLEFKEFIPKSGRHILGFEKELIESNGLKWCGFLGCVVNGDTPMSKSGRHSLFGRDFRKLSAIQHNPSFRIDHNKQFIFSFAEEKYVNMYFEAKSGVPMELCEISITTSNVYTKFIDYIESIGLRFCSNIGVVNSSIEFSDSKSNKNASNIGILISGARDRIVNRKKIRVAQAKYSSSENGKKKTMIWREKNRELISHRSNEYSKKRANEDPRFNLIKRLRYRTWAIFKRKKIPKTKSTQEMIGFNWDTLERHIESQFVDGMSWENRGEWHIDHIIPLSSGNTEEEIIKLCHWTNLQPLWATDNLSKGARIIY